jgi:hypothetical protein
MGKKKSKKPKYQDSVFDFSNDVIVNTVIPNIFAMLGNAADYFNGFRISKAFKNALERNKVASMCVYELTISDDPVVYNAKFITEVSKKFKSLRELYVDFLDEDGEDEYYFDCEFDDLPKIDWTVISFPELESLNLCSVPLKSISFSQTCYPKLNSLHISYEDYYGNYDYLEPIVLDLPNLYEIYLENIYLGKSSGLWGAISKLKNLEDVTLIGVGFDQDSQKVELPECINFTLDSCFEIDQVEIALAPNLELIELKSMSKLKLLLPKATATTEPTRTLDVILEKCQLENLDYIKAHPSVTSLKIDGADIDLKKFRSERKSALKSSASSSATKQSKPSKAEKAKESVQIPPKEVVKSSIKVTEEIIVPASKQTISEHKEPKVDLKQKKDEKPKENETKIEKKEPKVEQKPQISSIERVEQKISKSEEKKQHGLENSASLKQKVEESNAHLNDEFVKLLLNEEPSIRDSDEFRFKCLMKKFEAFSGIKDGGETKPFRYECLSLLNEFEELKVSLSLQYLPSHYIVCLERMCDLALLVRNKLSIIKF